MGKRMVKEHTVSPVCSLAWQHCTLYSCNNITHSSSGRRLKFNTFIRHFYYLLLSFHSCFSPRTLSHLYSCFFFIAPLYIIFYFLPPSLPLCPSSLSVPLSSAVAPWLFITPAVVHLPLISGGRHSGISVISISVTCLSFSAGPLK